MITALDDPDVLRVIVLGELDLSNATWFTGLVVHAVDPSWCRCVRIDLSGLRFLDAAGIRALLLCAQQAGQVAIVNPQPIVHRVLKITNLLHMISPTDAGERAPALRQGTG